MMNKFSYLDIVATDVDKNELDLLTSWYAVYIFRPTMPDNFQMNIAVIHIVPCSLIGDVHY